MVKTFGRLIAPYARRIRLMIARGVVRMVNDAGALQTVQVTVMGEPRNLERFGQYGLAGNPPAGAESVVASVCGSPDHGIVIAVEHRKYRLKGLKGGEVAFYDDLGQKVYLTREGILLESDKKITATAPEINLGGERETLLALVDERILQLLNDHTHPVNGATTGKMAAPLQAATVCTATVRGK